MTGHIKTQEDRHLVTSLITRANRLVRLLELPSPSIIVSNEIELVLKALEQIETKFGDRDTAARVRLVSKLHLDREIEEAGGEEAWSRKVEQEMDAEDELDSGVTQH